MKKLAIIKGVGFGLRDVGQACLWFATHIDESEAALQIFVGKELERIVKESGCYDISEIEGKSCWVECKDGVIRFKEFSKI